MYLYLVTILNKYFYVESPISYDLVQLFLYLISYTYLLTVCLMSFIDFTKIFVHNNNFLVHSKVLTPYLIYMYLDI